jgi:hypothetical protein
MNTCEYDGEFTGGIIGTSLVPSRFHDASLSGSRMRASRVA